MLLRLVRTYLSPYRSWLAVIVALQFIARWRMLYLPKINADIIDKGVVNGDTGYIVRHGGLMLLVSPGADRLLDRGRVVLRAHGDGLRPRRPGRRSSTGSGRSRPGRSSTSARRR